MTTRVARLGDLADRGVLIIGDGYRTSRAEHAPSGFRILRAADVGDGKVSANGRDFVGRQYRRQIGSKAARAGDVLLTTKGSVGRVAMMPDSPDDIVYSPQLCFFRIVDHNAIEPRFLMYWFKSKSFLEQASDRMNNTDMAAYINLADIRSLLIDLPCISEQRALVEILGALDDMAAVNERVTRSLRAYMASCYEYSLNRGAQVIAVDKVAQFHNNRRIPLSSNERRRRPGSVPYYGASGVFDYVDTALFDGRYLLVGEDGSVVQSDGRAVLQYIWGRAWVNNHAHVLTGVGMSTEVLHLSLNRTRIDALVTGAVQPKLSMGNLKSALLEVPVGCALAHLEHVVECQSALLRAKIDESATIHTLRDTLLLELMSRRLQVKDAEQPVGDVV